MSGKVFIIGVAKGGGWVKKEKVSNTVLGVV
jgi:hypothetical protein